MNAMHITPDWQDASGGRFRAVDIRLSDHPLHTGGSGRGIEARFLRQAARPSASEQGEQIIVRPQAQRLILSDSASRLWLKSATTQFNAEVMLGDPLAGDGEVGLPPGGTAGQIIVKQSTEENDAAWVNSPYALTSTVVEADNLKADIASPTFTGSPAAPTAAPGNSSTQLATTAFVTTADNLKAPLASPAFTGVPTAPTAAPGTTTTQLATTAFVTALQSSIDAKLDDSQLSTDSTLAANSDTLIASQKATKSYVDNSAAGLHYTTAVRVATTVAGTLASSFENGDTVDGVVLATGNRILIKDQAAGAENGIYTVNASGVPTRGTDADTGAEIKGIACLVTAGTANAGSQWQCSNATAPTIGTTAITFAQIASGASSYSAGTGLSLTGNQFAVSDPELLAILGLASAADRLPYFTGAGAAALAPYTNFARSFDAAATDAAARAVLNLGSSATQLSDTLRSFGAVGNGTTDDRAAIVTAFASGRALCGENLVYGISGTLDMPDGLFLRDATFKQLSPSTNGITLRKSSGSGSVTLLHVKVDRGSGDTLVTYGISLASGNKHYLDNVEVYGHGKGAGFSLYNTNNSFFGHLYCHDMRYNDLAATNDVLSAIEVVNVNNSIFLCPRITGITGNGLSPDWGLVAGGDTPVHTRGFSFAQGNGTIIVAPHIEGTGEAIDYTGSLNKDNNQIIGGLIDTPMGYGLKIFGNDTTNQMVATSLVVRRSGLPAFIIGGEADNSRLVNCVAIDTGYVSVPGTHIPVYSTAGTAFWIGNFLANGHTLMGCLAIDTQAVKTMRYGFQNEPVYDPAFGYNKLINCESFGHTIAAFKGWHEPRCTITRTSGQSFSTGSEQAINWQNELTDTMGMHTGTASTITTPAVEPGIYQIYDIRVAWSGNASGTRSVRLMGDFGAGEIQIGATMTEPGNAAGQVQFVMDRAFEVPGIATFRLLAMQNSGATLTIGPGSFFNIRKVAAITTT